jgi:bile acid:Na+ symporter, BASS family
VKTVLDIGVLLVTLLLMVTVGMELEGGDFREVARRKAALLGALLLPAILLPLLAFALARALALPAHVMAGLLLLAACPVGDIANFYTLLGRGNLALSVSVNTLSCLLSVATMALAFTLYDRLLGQHFSFALPTLALVLRLTVMVAMPVLAGMAVRRWKKAWAVDHGRLLRQLCVAGIALLTVYVLLNRGTQVAADWWQTALASLSFMVTALATGLILARLLRLSASDTIAVGIVFAVRNVALAMAIALTMLNRIEFAEVAVVYFIAEVPLLLGVSGACRRWWSSAPPLPESAGART